MVTTYLGLGTNLGNRMANLDRAVSHIEHRIGRVVRCSAPFLSKPWGFSSPNDFVNLAIAVETSLSPLQLLAATQQIERDMGRATKSAGGVYSDRIIDIDILLYGDQIINLPDLQIPHPRISERDFVRIPLSEVLL